MQSAAGVEQARRPVHGASETARGTVSEGMCACGVRRLVGLCVEILCISPGAFRFEKE